jgi:Tfp pilus assembly protein PilE
MQKNNHSGLTKTELVVLTAVIIVLSWLTIPNFQAMQLRAKEIPLEEVTRANMDSVRVVIEDWRRYHNGMYPTQADHINDLTSCTPQLRNPYATTTPDVEYIVTTPDVDTQHHQAGAVVAYLSGTGYIVCGFDRRSRLLNDPIIVASK